MTSKTRQARIHLTACLAALLTPGIRASAETPPQSPEPDSAFLFVYDVPAENRADFEAGYRQHLEWHRQAGDRLAWYGWYVVSGAGLGRFVDGTFGLAPEAFDQRVDPAGDRADFAKTVGLSATAVSREVLRIRDDLGSGRSLEERDRSRMLHVIRYLVEPGARQAFEAAVRERRKRQDVPYAWYELVSGGRHPSYLRVTPCDTWAELQRVEVGSDLPNVVEVSSSTWAYREDLSYFPAEP